MPCGVNDIPARLRVISVATDRFLQLLERLGNGGLGKVQLVGCKLQTAFLSNLDETLDVSEFYPPIDHLLIHFGNQMT